MPNSPVDKLHQEFQNLAAFLESASETSFQNIVDDHFRKSILLAAASYFEEVVTNSVIEFVYSRSTHNEVITEFVRNKALARQYHTLFDWESNNANKFFSLFGDSFKAFMSDQVKSDEALKESIVAFIEIGRERNRLVHQNFATYSLEKTTEELYTLYTVAAKFPAIIQSKLDVFCSTP